MNDLNDMWLNALKPYYFSALWMGISALLVLLCVACLVLAWRKREESGGISWVYAAASLIPAFFAIWAMTAHEIDLWKGGLFFVLALGMATGNGGGRPRRRRYRH